MVSSANSQSNLYQRAKLQTLSFSKETISTGCFPRIWLFAKFIQTSHPVPGCGRRQSLIEISALHVPSYQTKQTSFDATLTTMADLKNFLITPLSNGDWNILKRSAEGDLTAQVASSHAPSLPRPPSPKSDVDSQPLPNSPQQIALSGQSELSETLQLGSEMPQDLLGLAVMENAPNTAFAQMSSTPYSSAEAYDNQQAAMNAKRASMKAPKTRKITIPP